jgi:hypothetical protein
MWTANGKTNKEKREKSKEKREDEEGAVRGCKPGGAFLMSR